MNFSLTPLHFLVAFATGAFSAYLASRRGRNPYGWFLIGFAFGLIGIMAIFFAPSKKGRPSPEPADPPLSQQAPPPPQIQGPVDKFWYYLDASHQQLGPMSLDALTTALKQGKISLSTYVWHEDLSEWKPLQELVNH